MGQGFGGPCWHRVVRNYWLKRGFVKMIELQKIKELKKKLGQEGFTILGVFGSSARDDSRQNSDIDILYEVNQTFLDQYRGFNGIARLEEIKEELRKELGREIDFSAKNSLSDLARKHILKDLIVV